MPNVISKRVKPKSRNVRARGLNTHERMLKTMQSEWSSRLKNLTGSSTKIKNGLRRLAND